MRAVCVAMVFAALVPAAARGEPIPVSAASVSVASSGGGFSQSGMALAQTALDLGTVSMASVSSVGTFLISGLSWNVNVAVSFMLEGLGRFDTLTLEVLNPVGTNDLKEGAQPSYMPAGFSSSNNLDGLSFAQDAGLARSAVFAGGSANLVADEYTHRGDILVFSGLAGADSARVTFGLRDTLQYLDRGRGPGPGFLLRISASDEVHAPEPASMLLLGTGLAGLIAARRRRKASVA
jgi:hypothetical protein